MIVQIDILTERRGDTGKQKQMLFQWSECNLKATQQEVKMPHHILEKDTNAPEMKRALKTWQ